MTALLLAGLAWAQDCSLGHLAADLDDAAEGYGVLDATRFADRLDAAALDLSCVAEPLSPTLAARYHLMVGLRAWADGREADADASFAAARTADPGFAIPESLVPAGHEVRRLYSDADAGSDAPIPAPLSGGVLLDGRPTTTRPTARPAIVQVVDAQGAVSATRYVHPDDPLPDYPAAAPAPRPAGPDPVPDPVPPRPRRPGWLVAGGVGVVGSVALYALASESAAQFVGPLPGVDHAGLEHLRTRTNAFVLGSAVSAGVGVVGVTGFVIRW